MDVGQFLAHVSNVVHLHSDLVDVTWSPPANLSKHEARSQPFLVINPFPPPWSKGTFSNFSLKFHFTLPQRLCIPNLVILTQLWRNFTFKGPKSPKNDPKTPPKTTFSNFSFTFHFTLPQRLCIPNLVILSQLWQNFTFKGPKSP